jgi:molybdopterin-guanine dinucleotide biosynthesis protein
MMDIKKFDILIIEGFKGKSFKLQKIIKTSLDLLIYEATKSEMYAPSETIAIISQKR